jgi:CheY-like chemotaxis protein
MKPTDRPTRRIDKTILIADDDRDVVDVLARRCRGLGLNVLTAGDAFTALATAKTQRPDFVCLDVSMPGGNGLSACEMLVNDDDCAAIPIMILTGNTDDDTIRRCHQMAAYYIEKCPNVWTRVGPLLRELLEDAQAVCPGNEENRVQ